MLAEHQSGTNVALCYQVFLAITEFLCTERCGTARFIALRCGIFIGTYFVNVKKLRLHYVALRCLFLEIRLYRPCNDEAL